MNKYVEMKINELVSKHGVNILDLQFIYKQGYFDGRIEALEENISWLQGVKK